MDLMRLFSLEFWVAAFERFSSFGGAAPFLLAAVESFLPPLPLVAIVTLNVAAYGPLAGFLYSWAGSCTGCVCVFFFMRFALRRFVRLAGERQEKIAKAREWVKTVTTPVLFMILMLPFTPSSFMNFAFGVSDYPAGGYIGALVLAKLIMIGSLALFGQSAVLAMKDLRFIIPAVLLVIVLYLLSRRISRKHGMKGLK